MSDPRAQLATVWYGRRTVTTAAVGNPARARGRQPSPVELLRRGTVLAGRYRVEESVGSGSFSVVYSACDLALNRWVAIKVSPSDEARAMVANEVRLQAACQHPNVMPLFDAGADAWAGVEFSVMPHYPGADLAAVLNCFGPMPFRTARSCVEQICSALEFLWQRRQMVHGDIKPANIWLTPSGAALLMDFNVAGLLVRGGRVGTPGYTAPEALRGRMDRRSDLFSLGCVLYECLTGEPAFADDDAVVSGRLVPMRQKRPEIRPELEVVVKTALAPAPADRYQTARELQTAVRYPNPMRVGLRGSWPLLARQGGYTLRRLRWAVVRALRYSFHHPVQALTVGALVWLLIRWLMAAAAVGPVS